MDFINRLQERRRLDRFAELERGGLAVVWGRRRVGKTRLLLEWGARHDALYTVADQSAAHVQRGYFAEAVATRLKGFADVVYPDWRSMFDRLSKDAAALSWRGPVVIDELPHLVVTAPELPSVLQNWIDSEQKRHGLRIVVAGSSQRMMQGLVLDGSAPLYGRADEILHVEPLSAAWIREALDLPDAVAAVQHYAVWGGIPRYWEIAERHGGDLEPALLEDVLRPSGVLHLEPERLLLEETPPAIALRPVLDAIGAGAHRLSEIASRIGRPATSLARPLQRLIDMGLIRRDVSFAEPPRRSKRALYAIADPFLALWFRVVAPHRASLASMPSRGAAALWKHHRGHLTASVWEELCRRAVPHLPSALTGLPPDEFWEPAARYWKGNEPEWDAAALSSNGESVLLGETRWSETATTRAAVERSLKELARKPVPAAPALRGRKGVRILFVPRIPQELQAPEDSLLIDAEHVLEALRERS